MERKSNRSENEGREEAGGSIRRPGLAALTTRNRIFRFILESPAPVSKQEIVNALNLSLPTVHQKLQELMADHLIRVGEVQKSTGGRPPVAYTVEENACYAIGLSVSANHLRFLLSNLKRQQLAYKKIRLKPEEWTMERLFSEMDLFIEENKVDQDRILGIGITIPGILNRNANRILLSPTLPAQKFSLQGLQKKSRYPIFITNDTKASALAELINRPAEERRKPFLYLLLEYGVGGAVCLDGKILHGSNGRSAEFGHMCLEPDGLLCNCGKHGCLEAYCGALRFTRDLGLTTEEFFQGLKEGKPELANLWEDVLEHLAMALVNLHLAFDYDIVLGGFVSEYMADYLPHLKELAASRDPFLNGEPADYLSIGKLRNAGMIGAAWHFISQFVSQV
jgi:predicted NBD/HSP70 family sugar kinase